jgi:hypothetical protein
MGGKGEREISSGVIHISWRYEVARRYEVYVITVVDKVRYVHL